MLFLTLGREPAAAAAVTVYGPPTRMPGIVKRPSACVTAS